jgi:hypothetical protein
MQTEPVLPAQPTPPSIVQPQPTGFIKDPGILRVFGSYALWLKIFAIFNFISAGFLILTGIIYVFTIIGIVISVIYWAIAGLQIWLNINLLQGAKNIEALKTCQTQEQYNSLTIENLKCTGLYFKVCCIMTMVGFGLVVVGLMFLMVIGLTGGFQNFDNLRSFSSSSSSYRYR